MVGVESGGAVRMTGPEFAGEVRLAAGAADRILFAGGEKEAGDHEVILAGGDRVRGTLVSMTSSAVAVDTSAAGRLKIPPSRVVAIRVAKSKDALLETDFTAGDGGPWKTRGSGSYWVLGEGGLEYLAQGDDPGMAPVFAPVEQKGAVTILAKIRPVGGNEIGVDLVLGSDGSVVTRKQVDVNQDDTNLYGPACIFATFERSEVNVSVHERRRGEPEFRPQPRAPRHRLDAAAVVRSGDLEGPHLDGRRGPGRVHPAGQAAEPEVRDVQRAQPGGRRIGERAARRRAAGRLARAGRGENGRRSLSTATASRPPVLSWPTER